MVRMVSASEDAAEEGGGCLVLVLKETEAEDLLAASSLTALLSPDMGGHLGMGRQIQDTYLQFTKIDRLYTRGSFGFMTIGV